jgi:putative glutamine amidotransferase
MRPRIGITKPDKEDNLAYAAIWFSVWLAGGKPIKLSPSSPYQQTQIDGLLLGGGKDVFPGLYDAPAKDAYQYDAARDDMEVYWAERARDEGIPVLGICRGAQLMNVVCGGTLHADISEFYKDQFIPSKIWHYAFYRKFVLIKGNSLLHKITGCRELKVNAIHKQAVDHLGDNLSIDASENNGIVQCISHKEHPFFIGVQFHPEFLIYRRVFRNIFKALVEAARQ